MVKTSIGVIDNAKIKKLYLDGCRANSIRPKQRNFNDFVKLLEGDFYYWMRGNLKYFFENVNR
ncbi:hypothetical protein COT99_00475 [Candidatus Falkowbacteria bacterium CG10_big_fil_rev_8_21_14_0_10_43_10]|uniref:Uncharacterized protein n=1 Tax=Candidatus Falkowbacteria bacterium CG10_big_fil_rev_8_21_14_0_10_43_10 TaxID=1974567 RepID=A0A2H0V315_9BACT|nr:MAG: hypothetical protein COT99_00475 [Candidatus Falkowbacteria bacterium CG10_big_fil_rev_8_21_14_0_10_43_10]